MNGIQSNNKSNISNFFQSLQNIIKAEIKFLGFRQHKPDLKNYGNYFLVMGLFTAWLAGVGRYWDNPRAEIWQYLGLGSLAYVFILALILWVLILPLKPKNWNYRSLLIFIGMTSPPAFFYSIPVERFFSLSTAQAMNVCLLVIVAAWRVALLIVYLKRVVRLSGLTIIVAALLPLTLIVSSLTALNLEHVVFNIMAGIKNTDKSANDTAYYILFTVTTFSIIASPVLLISYIAIIVKSWKKPVN